MPVDPQAAYDAGTTLIGCDIGKEGDEVPELTKIGQEIIESTDMHTLFATLDHVSAMIVKRLIEEADDECLIYTPGEMDEFLGTGHFKKVGGRK